MGGKSQCFFFAFICRSRVHKLLHYDVGRMMICSVFFIEHQLVQTERQTDIRTDGHGIGLYRGSITSRVENYCIDGSCEEWNDYE